MRNKLSGFILTGALILCALIFTASGEAQKKRAAVCGDPTVRCGGTGEFQSYDLPFRLPPRAVIYETELFYAVILESRSAKTNCEAHFSEDERLEAQSLFPHNKVFADRCPEPGTLFYSNTNTDYRFMAVYAGRTRAEAQAMLSRVRATGKYPSANLRRMYVGFNGT